MAATTLSLVAADGWCLIAASKTSGTTTPRFHKYVYSSNVWTHEDGAATLADPSAPANNAWLGALASSDFWDGDIALAEPGTSL